MLKDFEYNALKDDIAHYFNILYKGFVYFVENHGDDDDCLNEIRQYIDDTIQNGYSWNLDKVKVVLEVLKLKGGDTAKNVLSFMEQSEYGWQDNTYHFYNKCLRHDDCRCKRNLNIDNSPEITIRAVADIVSIFLHEECVGFTTYLFCYCLAALFSSKLLLGQLNNRKFSQY